MYNKLIENEERLFDLALSSFNIKVNSITFKCPKCGKKVDDPEEWEFTEHVGECLSCDHVRGDLR